jgi:hypothetical protein
MTFNGVFNCLVKCVNGREIKNYFEVIDKPQNDIPPEGGGFREAVEK